MNIVKKTIIQLVIKIMHITSWLETKVTPPKILLLKMIVAYWMTQGVYVAAKLRIADHLKSGPRTNEELAALVDADPRNLYRLMRMLVGNGIFDADDQGRYRLNAIAKHLLTDNPDSLYAMATIFGGDFYRAWGSLDYSVQTGKTAFDHVFGQPLFEYLKANKDTAEDFRNMVNEISLLFVSPVAEVYDFSPFRTIVDVGGGLGLLLSRILHNHPDARGNIFDLPEVAADCEQYMKSQNLSQRYTFTAGDFFRQVPGGGDLYLLSQILHDWNDEHNITILKNCHDALPPAAKLLIIETVVPEGNEHHLSKFDDVNMMVLTGGQERTAAEYTHLLERAGFLILQIVPTPSPVSIIEACPVK
jgi:hypothetical protein